MASSESLTLEIVWLNKQGWKGTNDRKATVLTHTNDLLM